MSVTVITPTADRPEAFALCEKYIGRQTVQPDQWIVVDDGRMQAKVTRGQEYYFQPEMRGVLSLAKKMAFVVREGLVKGDIIVVVEDDDWYAPDWIEFCVEGLKNCTLFGEGRALYYNVRSRWWQRHNNMGHASFCSTAFRRQALPALGEVCELARDPWVDTQFWLRRELPRVLIDPMTTAQNFRHRTVGIKAMPGLTGYSMQHRQRVHQTIDDPELSMLRSLIGDDADAYAEFFDPTADTVLPSARRTSQIVHSITGQLHGTGWFELLSRFRGQKKIQGLEIGRFNPDAAEWMLDNVFTDPGSTFYLAGNGTAEYEACQQHLRRFNNVRLWPAVAGLAEVEALKSDFIYIDRVHAALGVAQDADMAIKLLKPGGVLIFADYKWAGSHNAADRPKMAVDAFAQKYNGQFRSVDLTGPQAIFIR